MTRARMIMHIRKRLKEEFGLDVPKDTIKKIIELEEEEIYAVIAQEDSFKYVWGTIYGEEVKPRKLAGTTAYYDGVLQNGGYSWWKHGAPKIRWSRVATICEKLSPKDFFEQEEQRYTTLARQFRQDLELPEIPEFEGLTEEQIKEINQKADDINFKKMAKWKQYRKERDDRINTQKLKGLAMYWQAENYVPYGSTSGYYTGVQDDLIDRGLMNLEKKKDSMLLVEYYDKLLMFKDIAFHKCMLDLHPEIEERIQKTKQELDEKGLTPLPHVDYGLMHEKVSTDKKAFGEENPWASLMQGEMGANYNPVITHQTKAMRLAYESKINNKEAWEEIQKTREQELEAYREEQRKLKEQEELNQTNLGEKDKKDKE